MGLLRILLIVFAILICFLVILPKSTREKWLADGTMKIIASICAALVICLSVAIYYWQDIAGKDQASIRLLVKRIAVQEGNLSKNLELSNYDLQNFSSSAILSVLNQQNKIDTLILKNVTAANIAKLDNIFASNSTLQTLVIKSTAAEAIMSALDLLEHKNFSSLVLRQNKLNAEVITKLISILALNQRLTSLYLEQANLTDNAMEQIVKLVTAPTKITELSLLGNQFSSSSLTELARALQKNTTLQTLKINIGKPVEANKQLFLQTLGGTQLKVYFDN